VCVCMCVPIILITKKVCSDEKTNKLMRMKKKDNDNKNILSSTNFIFSIQRDCKRRLKTRML